MSADRDYPWYAIATGVSIEQGDIIDACPVMLPTYAPSQVRGKPEVDWESRDVIVLTQSCDLVLGREKVPSAVLCATYRLSEINAPHLRTTKGLEDARRGHLPGTHLLAACDLPSHERELQVVSFRSLFSLPVGFIRQHLDASGPRLRLLPPYREHLAQAFARYFMRVGLPADVPPFR